MLGLPRPREKTDPDRANNGRAFVGSDVRAVDAKVRFPGAILQSGREFPGFAKFA